MSQLCCVRRSLAAQGWERNSSGHWFTVRRAARATLVSIRYSGPVDAVTD